MGKSWYCSWCGSGIGRGRWRASQETLGRSRGVGGGAARLKATTAVRAKASVSGVQEEARARPGEEGRLVAAASTVIVLGHTPERPCRVMAHSKLPVVGMQGADPPMVVAVPSSPRYLARRLRWRSSKGWRLGAMLSGGGYLGDREGDTRGGAAQEEAGMGLSGRCWVDSLGEPSRRCRGHCSCRGGNHGMVHLSGEIVFCFLPFLNPLLPISFSERRHGKREIESE